MEITESGTSLRERLKLARWPGCCATCCEDNPLPAEAAYFLQLCPVCGCDDADRAEGRRRVADLPHPGPWYRAEEVAL